jgi:hypothetical protein
MQRGALIAMAVMLVACAKADVNRDGGGDDDDDTDATEPDPPDAGPPDANNCPVQPCTILPPCGCESPVSTRACDVDVGDLMGTACREIVTPGRETNACTGLDGCDAGYVCLGGGGHSACKKYCTSTADCSPPRGQCVIQITDGTNPIPGLPAVCSSNCDPVNTAGGGCPSGWKCNFFTQPFMGMNYNIADCSFAGAGGQGANCTGAGTGDDTLCAANFSCTTINGGASFQCRRICNRSAGGPQCGGLTCLAFNPAFVLAGTEYGVCN